jgi:hypothetical protein
LCLLATGTYDIWKVDRSISCRGAAIVAEDWPTLGLHNAKTFKLRRDYVYGLNFYLHRELSEWAPADGKNMPVFTNHKNAVELRQQGFDCLEYADYAIFPAVIVCGDDGKRPRVD